VAIKTECTSVRFNLSDDLKGMHGGSYGVRIGHTDSIFALEKGPVNVFEDEALALSGECGDGFATVKNNQVKLVVESFLKY